ncbi:universal stress protein UspA [Amycolatopsis antarctica]|uniref:Universal stress protein UspA n=1 Tax=Amycolatopsis antarctica TaxID=1854586 RepID=A0A263DCJ1_9PSEU|nr:universal stress protein [Amycolatopsis antarctica]OZM75206.1 universal stress protein UspA [Amycolatopsis antarctica]
MSRVLVWLVEGTWTACVDAARGLTPDAEFVLLHAVDPEVTEAVHGAYEGLLSRHGHDPAELVEAASGPAERELLEAAVARLGRPARTAALRGRVEHAVVAACAPGDVLVCARDGEPGHCGPASLGHHTRYVVDHAPCAVFLVR